MCVCVCVCVCVRASVRLLQIYKQVSAKCSPFDEPWVEQYQS